MKYSPVRKMKLKKRLLFSPHNRIEGNQYIYHGLGSSVGIVTDHGLEGPELNPSEDEIFRPSRLALGPTQTPIKWVPGLSQD